MTVILRQADSQFGAWSTLMEAAQLQYRVDVDVFDTAKAWRRASRAAT